MLIVENVIQKHKSGSFLPSIPSKKKKKYPGHWQGFLGAEIVEWILSDCNENPVSALLNRTFCNQGNVVIYSDQCSSH